MGQPKKYSWWEKLYYPEIARGMSITLRHFWVNVIGFLPLIGRLVKQETVTYQWPEQERPIHPRWRGRHRLNKREDGTVRCVACMCCATACPSECIHIVARERTDGVEEKEPAVFEIDLFRCVYCGMCVEACPCDAIYMDIQEMRLSQYDPEKFVITRKELLDW